MDSFVRSLLVAVAPFLASSVALAAAPSAPVELQEAVDFGTPPAGLVKVACAVGLDPSVKADLDIGAGPNAGSGVVKAQAWLKIALGKTLARHCATIGDTAPQYVLTIESLKSDCSGNAFKARCITSFSYQLRLQPSGLVVLSGDNATEEFSADARMGLAGAPSDDIAVEQFRRRLNGQKLALQGALVDMLKQIDAALTEGRPKFALTAPGIVAKTQELVTKYFFDGACGAYNAAAKAWPRKEEKAERKADKAEKKADKAEKKADKAEKRAKGESDDAETEAAPSAEADGGDPADVQTWFEGRDCDPRFDTPVCLNDGVMAKLFSQSDLATWREQGLRKALDECSPKPPDGPLYAALTMQHGKLIWLEVAPLRKQILAESSVPFAVLIWDALSKQAIAIALPAKAGAGAGEVWAVTPAGPKATKLATLSTDLHSGVLTGASLAGSTLTLNRSNGKPVAVKLDLAEGSAAEAWTVATDAPIIGKGHGFVLRIKSDLALGADSGALSRPIGFQRNAPAAANGTFDQTVAARLDRWIALIGGKEADALLRQSADFMQDTTIVDRFYAEIVPAYDAWNRSVEADGVLVMQEHGERLKKEQCDRSDKMVLEVKAFMKHHQSDKAEERASEALDLCNGNSEAQSLKNALVGERQSKEQAIQQRAALAAQHHEMARKENILRSVPMLKASCLSALQMYQAAQTAAGRAAAAGRPDIARRADAAKNAALFRLRESQNRLREAIGIYRERGEGNLGNAVQQASYQCLRL